MSKIDAAIDLFDRFFEFQKEFHQKIFATIPFSIGDIFYVGIILLLIFFILKSLRKTGRKEYLLKILVLINVLYFVYQIFWGMLYFQQPLLEKLPEKIVTTENLKRLSLEYLERCTQSRTLVKEDTEGVFTVSDLSTVKSEILNNQKTLPSLLNSKKGTDINSFKSSLFKPIMSYTGILGYYNPFSAEAQFNSQLPSTYLPFTLAHESAHQLGYAKEQEANFIGFLIGNQALNSDLKYSTQYFVLKSLLNSLQEQEPEFVISVLERYSPGMKRDRLAEKEFIKKNEGFLDVFFSFTNDLFLKSNQQDGSITYSYFIDLLSRYE